MYEEVQRRTCFECWEKSLICLHIKEQREKSLQQAIIFQKEVIANEQGQLIFLEDLLENHV